MFSSFIYVVACINISFLLWMNNVCVQLCPALVTPWTVACQAPLSIGFSRQEYWSGLSFPPPGNFPNPGIEPRSPTLQVDSLQSEPAGKPSVWIIFHCIDTPHVVCFSVELIDVWIVSLFFDCYGYCCNEHSFTGWFFLHLLFLAALGLCSFVWAFCQLQRVGDTL